MRRLLLTLVCATIVAQPGHAQTITGRALLTADGPDVTHRVWWSAQRDGARRLDLGVVAVDLDSGFEQAPDNPARFSVPRLQNVTLRAGLPGVQDSFSLLMEREATLRSGMFGDKSVDLVFDAALVGLTLLADPADSYAISVRNMDTGAEVTLTVPSPQIDLLMVAGTYRITPAGLRNGPESVISVAAGDIRDITLDGRARFMDIVLGATDLWADGMEPLHLALTRPGADAFDFGPKAFVPGRTSAPVQLSAGEWNAVLTDAQGYGRTLFEGVVIVDPDADVLHIPFDYAIARPRLDMTDPDTAAMLAQADFPTFSVIETVSRGLPFAQTDVGPDGAAGAPMLVVKPANLPDDAPIALRFSSDMDTFSLQPIAAGWNGQVLDLTLRVGEGAEMCLRFYGTDMCPLAQAE